MRTVEWFGLLGCEFNGSVPDLPDLAEPQTVAISRAHAYGDLPFKVWQVRHVASSPYDIYIYSA